jgi:hypothetical protein
LQLYKKEEVPFMGTYSIIKWNKLYNIQYVRYWWSW